mmetsp:Transcript_167433/g.532251  ORF Transcript_167433/g.532251 Transcript_167433/m.532251 type:complete len:580 (-) Transcript_167433:38-1777(-)
MLTLLSLSAFAEWPTVLRPMSEESPLATVMLVAFILALSVSVLALILGVASEQAAAAAERSAAMRCDTVHIALAELAVKAAAAFADGAGLGGGGLPDLESDAKGLEEAVCRLLFCEGVLRRRLAPSSQIEDVQAEILGELREIRGRLSEFADSGDSKVSIEACSFVADVVAASGSTGGFNGKALVVCAVPLTSALLSALPSPCKGSGPELVVVPAEGSSGPAGGSMNKGGDLEAGKALKVLGEELRRLASLGEELHEFKALALEGARLSGKEEERKAERDRRFEELDLELRRSCAVDSAKQLAAGSAPPPVGGSARRAPEWRWQDMDRHLHDLRLELKSELEALRGVCMSASGEVVGGALVEEFKEELRSLRTDIQSALRCGSGTARESNDGSSSAGDCGGPSGASAGNLAVPMSDREPKDQKEPKQGAKLRERLKKQRIWFSSPAKAGIHDEDKEVEDVAAEIGQELRKLRSTVTEAMEKLPPAADMQRLHDELVSKLLGELRLVLQTEASQMLHLLPPSQSVGSPSQPRPPALPSSSLAEVVAAATAAGKVEVGLVKSAVPHQAIKQLCAQGVLHMV